MEFKNKENEKLQLPLKIWQVLANIFLGLLGKEKYEGRMLWLSRACAVVASVVVIKDKVPHILVNKRGKGSADFQGFWNLPCGYLDWDENTKQATMREVWEECGVDLQKLIDDKLVTLNFMDEVWDTNSEPNENRQNVTFHHGLLAVLKEGQDFPSTSLENNEPDEVEEVEWMPLSEYKDRTYAFGHEARIEKFMKKTLLDVYLDK